MSLLTVVPYHLSSSQSEGIAYPPYAEFALFTPGI